MERENLENLVYESLAALPADKRFELADRLKAIIDAELLKGALPELDYVCPICGCDEFTRYGKTRRGTQRWRCSCCGNVRVHESTGRIIGNTKLDYDTWVAFIPLFLDHISCDKVAERLGVCHKTAWFMRIRLLEAVFDQLPSFQVKAGSNVQVDEIYFRESFKGTRFESMTNPPREPRTGDGAGLVSGISDEQICVITAVNDNRDFFFDVACRGAMTVKIAESSLRGRISSGAIVNTDRHKSYPKVLATLGVAIHNAFDSKARGGLESVNHTHSAIKTFLAPFFGVSTKWLHLYLGWYKWLRSFKSDFKAALSQMGAGDYTHTWEDIRAMGTPFRDSRMNPLKA